MARDPSFSIPARPQRRFPRRGGVEYEGQTLFRLAPEESMSDEALADLLAETLAAGPYRYGDFLNLPMVLYLVRDQETGDVFRVSVRDGRVRLHVLPETESAGLRRLYERLADRSGVEWAVDCRTSE
jgi:hypothetical protein